MVILLLALLLQLQGGAKMACQHRQNTHTVVNCPAVVKGHQPGLYLVADWAASDILEPQGGEWAGQEVARRRWSGVGWR